jgi:glycine/D-amino acid oxidase-like deaminating enzyme/nitrite reductase/ring-hydroxylating ferredoxin subunit
MDGKKTSLWLDTRAAPGFPPLAGDAQVDVVIVGAGITGLTAARLLVEAGRTVAVLEQERIGAGTTGGTSAHVTQVPDRRFREIDSKFGHDGVRTLVASSRVALDRIAAWAEEGGIDCDFQRVPAYLYTENPEEVSRLEEEARIAREAGMSAELVREVPLPFRVAAAVRFDGQARFHPISYLAGLAHRIAGGGGRIHEGTRVVEVEGGHRGEPCRVVTKGGAIVTAGSVLFATHTPGGFTLLHAELEALRSYVMAVRLRDQAPPDGLFFDTADPYNYTRMQPDERGDLLIVGGKDHPTGQEWDTEACHRELEEYIRERWNVESVEYRWSAQFYEPPDGLPLIGESLSSDRVLVATGYSGTGMMFGTLGGMLLADRVLERPNPWAALYETKRLKPLAAGPQLAKLNLGVVKHFVQDRVEIPKVRDLSEVPLGEGRVVEIGDEKVAVYRGQDGVVHTISPVCTHAACIVQWNAGEKSWDCPCHGSRFTPDGQIIEGPAVKRLEPVQVQTKVER